MMRMVKILCLLLVAVVAARSVAEACDNPVYTLTIRSSGGQQCYTCTSGQDCQNATWEEGWGDGCVEFYCNGDPENTNCNTNGDPCGGLAASALTLTPAGTAVARYTRSTANGTTVSGCSGFIVSHGRILRSAGGVTATAATAFIAPRSPVTLRI